MRKSGIILPIFSLPSNYGVGTFGIEAYKFVDFLEKANQSYWQILPIGPTSYGDSPYQSFSTFAGNPYFIDLDLLIKDELLKQEEINTLDFGKDNGDIDYEKLYLNRYKVLKIAFNRFDESNKEYEEFKDNNNFWIYDYALFMALKDYNEGKAWTSWKEDIRTRKKRAIIKYSTTLKDEIEFQMFMQFKFYEQWETLRIYANKKGIEIIGDIPIYVAEDSSDVWANTRLFMLDDNLVPTNVAGCPPDAFSDTGQLWGNPIYNWEVHKEEKFKWWIERVKSSLGLFDVVRIDHFRGFVGYWSIPYGDETAIDGKWEVGPGIELFDSIKDELGDINVIAEDLGYITEDVRDLLDYCGFPGMRVLQFAFDPKGDSEYLPHNFDKNTVAYTGTHDNDTIKGWFKGLSKEEKKFCMNYTNMRNENDNWSLIKAIISSTANTAIVQMQDLLNISSEGRINFPSKIGFNWRWRMDKSHLNGELANKLKYLTILYRRNMKK